MFMPRALAQALAPLAKQTIGKDWAMYSGLLDHWQEIVGESYAQTTTPVKVSFPHQPTEPRRKGGTLTIRLPKGLAMEFTYKAEIIRQRINDYFGYDAIARIALDTVSILPPAKSIKAPTIEATQKAHAAVSDVENDELRAALEKLGAQILNRDRSTGKR